MAAKSNALLIVVSAPSGAGKTTLCHQVLKAYPAMTRAVTCTTRPPREGERDGVDYYFLSREAFQKKVKAGKFLEHATVYQNCYGTLKSEVLGKLRAGRDVLLNIDVQGAASIRKEAARNAELKRSLVSIFLTTPTLAELEQRLRGRGTESPEVFKRRLDTARQEIAQWRHFDYLLISGTRPEDLRRMQAIIEAEKLRQNRSIAPKF